MKTIELQIPDGKTAVWKDNVLTLVDEEKPKDIRERIKTFEDAYNTLNMDYCKEHGTEPGYYAHPLCKEYDKVMELTEKSPDIVAYLKLRIIVAALNEGWIPKFEKDEYRYYPWFYLYTQKEIDEMSEEERADITLTIWGGHSSNGANCGLGYSSSYDDWAVSASSFSARLALRTSDLAVYCGKQFIDIWKDYVVEPSVIYGQTDEE